MSTPILSSAAIRFRSASSALILFISAFFCQRDVYSESLSETRINSSTSSSSKNANRSFPRDAMHNTGFSDPSRSHLPLNTNAFFLPPGRSTTFEVWVGGQYRGLEGLPRFANVESDRDIIFFQSRNGGFLRASTVTGIMNESAFDYGTR